jgi:outer membrane protein OmpA-like peptidoglycan-associated protein
MILRCALLTILALFSFQLPALANPSQYGSSGLLNIPTADTLDSANLCVGVWGNCSKAKDNGLYSIMPVTLTLGIGTFWEAYGTYPNVALNENETAFSGRGTADVGMKLRFFGQRSSKIKLAADIHMSRHIDDDLRYNGVTDIGEQIIASLRLDTLAAHLYGGYQKNGQSRDVVNGTRDNTEFPSGLGLEYSPTSRSKATLELTVANTSNLEAPIEASLGFQYYLTPHFTLNLSYGMGLNDSAASWRTLFGLSTCQGVGAYIKPIPAVKIKAGRGPSVGEVIKPFKIIPLSPLLIKTPALTTPASKFEIPVEADEEEIVIRPYGTVVIAQQPAATPVTMPKMISPEQLPISAGEETVAAVEPVIDAVSPTESSVTRVSGVTPLYGVRLKGKVTKVDKIPGAPVSAYRKFRLPDNIYEFDNTDIIPEVKKSISELAEFIRKDDKWVFLRIDGHTDGVGSVKYNLDLSLKRAISIANYLITREGIDPSRVFIRGMGKSAPIADNSTDEGRKMNRRFEIVFLVHKEKTK